MLVSVIFAVVDVWMLFLLSLGLFANSGLFLFIFILATTLQKNCGIQTWIVGMLTNPGTP